MNTKSKNMIKGMAIGMSAAAAVGMVGSKMGSSKKKLKKTACKALTAVGDFVDNVQYMVK